MIYLLGPEEKDVLTMVDFKALASMTPEEREEERKQQQLRIEEKQKEYAKEIFSYKEILFAAAKHPNLSSWEKDFISSLIAAFISNHIQTKDELSIKQRNSFSKIERKIYSV